MITPNSKIRLLKAPFEMDSNNELTFSSLQSQTNYFLSLPYDEMDEATYQRKEERIRYDKGFDELIGYNYCMYQNTEYSNKWFYAFIERVEYVNDNTSYLYIRTDVFQSWMFDYTWKASFIEREHVEDDTVGLHTIDEGLTTGEYISNGGVIRYTDQYGTDNTEKYIVGFACSDLPSGLKSVYDSYLNARSNAKIFNGLYIIALPNPAQANIFIKVMSLDNKFDAIINIFMLPSRVSDLYQTSTHRIPYTYESYSNIPIFIFDNPFGIYVENVFSITTPTSLNSYVPKNNKLLVYPYSLFTISNQSGTDSEFRFEDFGESAKFVEYSSITGGGVTGKLVPFNYKNVEVNYDYSIEKGKLPTCGWVGDAYINWLSANAVNISYNNLKAGASLLMGGVNLLSGDLEGASQIGSGIGGILNTMIEKEKASRLPDTFSGNVASGDINYSSGNSGYSYNKLTLKTEYLTQIDNFFSMYGYKVNELKIPNLYSRPNWNYIKTINVNLIGEIPQEDMVELRSLFNQGITLWHNPSTFLDYSQNNKF